MARSRSIRTSLISGLVLMVPLGVTVLVLRLLFDLLSSVLEPVVGMVLPNSSPAAISLISFVSMVAVIYLVGLLATGVGGRRAILAMESMIAPIRALHS